MKLDRPTAVAEALKKWCETAADARELWLNVAASCLGLVDGLKLAEQLAARLEQDADTMTGAIREQRAELERLTEAVERRRGELARPRGSGWGKFLRFAEPSHNTTGGLS